MSPGPPQASSTTSTGGWSASSSRTSTTSQRPAAQRDRVARAPSRNGGLEGRRISGCPAFELEPEQKPCHSDLPFRCRLVPNGTASIRQAAGASNRFGAASESGVAAPVSAAEGLEKKLPPPSSLRGRGRYWRIGLAPPAFKTQKWQKIRPHFRRRVRTSVAARGSCFSGRSTRSHGRARCRGVRDHRPLAHARPGGVDLRGPRDEPNVL